MVTIVETTTRKQMMAFAKFPISLYKDCEYYTPSFLSDDYNIINPKKNLSLSISEVKCFLAYKDGKLVGRVAAIINHLSNKNHNEKCIRFNRIDFIDDYEVSEALIKAVEDYGRSKGLEYIHGPWGFNDTDREGMQTYGFDEYASYATAYSYPYYIEHMERLGFTKESEWLEYRVDFSRPDPRFKRIAEQLVRTRHYRNVCETMPTKKVIKKYGDSFFDCYNAAYSTLDNFIPLDKRAKKATLKQFGTILNNHFFSIIVNDKDQVIAFVIVLPYIGDVLRKAKGRLLPSIIPLMHTIKHPKKLELTLMGVHPDYRNSGAQSLAMKSFEENYQKFHIEDAFSDPILTTNSDMLSTWKGMKITTRAKRQTFKKHL